MMTARGLIVFKHDSDLGNATADSLFKRVKIERIGEGAPRDFENYAVTVDEAGLPEGVTIQRLF
jgi:CRISPR-associated protein Csd2